MGQRGALSVGDDIMKVLVAGVIREEVFAASTAHFVDQERGAVGVGVALTLGPGTE